jgi:CRP-like cAMP-binding protein
MATTRLVTPALFCTLEPGRVDGILLDAPVVELESGVELAQADLAGVCLIVVDEGVVIVRAEHLGSARGIVTCHAGPGRLVLPPGDGEAVRTLTPTRAMLLTTSIRDRLFAVPEAAVLLFDETAATLASIHHVDRVRDKLIQLAREHGRVRRDGVLLDFPLTHELLGEMVGSARETVTRALDELEEEGFVTRRGRSYRLNVAPEVLGTQSPAL